MPQNWKTVRIFISSTFRDMHAERNYLINNVFLELRDWCAKHGLHLIDVDLRWGVTEEEEKQGKVLGICLDEIQRCRPFFIGLLGERYGVIPPEYYVPDEPQFDWVHDFEKGHSLTALEIYHGVLRDPAMKARAFFYFRDPKFIDDLPPECRVDFLPENDDAKQKLLALKDEIRAHCPVYENYPSAYGGLDPDGRVTLTQLEDFGKRILTDLKAAVSAEHRVAMPQPNALEIERGYHETFTENSTKRFIGRRALLDELRDYCDSQTSTSLVVTGGPGCGKSALLAKFAKEYAEKHEMTFVLTHFVGVSPGSTDVFRTLLRLSRELKQKFNIAEDVPADYYELRQLFPKLLESAAASGKLLLIVDALDQLDESSLHHSLPVRLPQGLKIIVSTLEGECLDLLHQHNAVLQKVIVGALTWEERREMVEQTLADYRKKLEETPENNQMRLLMNKAESDQPLYLIVACEEMRLFGEFGRVTEKIAALGNNVEELFGQVIGRLENVHGEAFIRKALSLIESARYGLLENEILELLRREGEQQLPHAIWSRLYWSLKLYLRPPGEGDEGTLGFFHRQLAKAVRQKYLSDNTNEVACHRRLAQYFKRKADPDEKGLWSGNYPRALSELPHHFLQGKLHQSLFQAARDDKFLQAQADAFAEEPFVQLDTLQKALTGAAQIDDAAKMAEFMLRHALRVMKIADVSLLDVLHEKQIQRALNLADLMFWRDKKRGTLSFLVLAWALKRQNRTKDAAKIMSDLAQKDLPGLAPHGWPELAAIALSHLADVDEASFLSVQEQLLDADGRVTLCQKLLAKYQEQATHPPNDRLMDLVVQITESITVEHKRALVLAEIAKIQAWGGRDKEAEQTAGKIIDPHAQAVVLTDITRAQVTAGKDQKALETAREISDEDDRVRALIAMAQVQVSMGREEEARQTFERALGIATAIDYAGMREPLLRDIAQAQAITGKVKEANRTVRKIRDEDNRDKALVEIAKAQATAGKHRGALRTARKIKSKYRRATALREITQAQAIAGKLKEANRTVRKIRDEDDRENALVEIAKAQAGVGRLEEAVKTIGKISQPNIRANAWVQIGKAQITGTDEEAERSFEEAVKTARGIGNEHQRAMTLREIAETLASDEQIEAALKVVREISWPYDREEALIVIAKAQARVGEHEAAIKTCKSITGDWRREAALREIAQAQADAEKFAEAERTFEEAVNTTREIYFKFDQAAALREIAQVQATTGKHQRAIETFAAALRLAREISNEERRAAAVSEIARAQATVGNVAEALRTAAEIDDYKRSEVLAEVAKTQTTAGRDDKALRAAKAIYDRSRRSKTLMEIATIQASAGRDEEALCTARAIDEWERIETLVEIAKAQTTAGKDKKAGETFAEAVRTAANISYEPMRVARLRDIAVAQVTTRQDINATETFEQAIRTAREIGDEYTRARVLVDIAQAQVTPGRFEEAEKTLEEAVNTTQKIYFKFEQAAALAEIAQVQATTGKHHSATETFAAALRLAREISDEQRRATAFSEIAQAQATAGNIEEALKITRDMNSGYMRSEALAKIAKAHVNAGRDEEALCITKEISNQFQRLEPLLEIAKAQAAAGKDKRATETFAEALSTVRDANSEDSRAKALLNIARAQVAIGKFDEAIRTTQLVLVDTDAAISTIAEALASSGTKDALKQLLAPASYHLSTTYRMCSLLAQVYSDDECAIDKVATLVTSYANAPALSTFIGEVDGY